MNNLKLGRFPEFDIRSRKFNIAQTILSEHDMPRIYRWKVDQYLDQGNVGACVGFSWSHAINGAITESVVSNQSALDLYHRAQDLDQWIGNNYEGSSVIAGAKATKELGKIGEYRWAFDTLDLAIAVSWYGCAVIGINWYEDMFYPNKYGFITTGGNLAGGHAICVRGYSTNYNAFLLRNSWGWDWGINGGCWLPFEYMDQLLKEDGDACIPIERYK